MVTKVGHEINVDIDEVFTLLCLAISAISVKILKTGTVVDAC